MGKPKMTRKLKKKKRWCSYEVDARARGKSDSRLKAAVGAFGPDFRSEV